MKNWPRRTAIKTTRQIATELPLRLAGLWLAAALCLAANLAQAAQVAGVIVNLSGPLMVRKHDGAVKVLAVKSEVEQGDTLVAEKNTYAMIRFIDNSEITLRPGTTFKIEAFAYDSARPEGDSASFNLVKGGLRSVTGLLGKRSREKFELKTPAATIGIRGTTFVAQWAGPPLLGAARTALAPGLHVQVLDGLVVLANAGGTQQFSAGQFGFAPNFSMPPLLVPVDPGLKFTPPPVFSAVLGAPGASAGVSKPDAVDCEVR